MPLLTNQKRSNNETTTAMTAPATMLLRSIGESGESLEVVLPPRRRMKTGSAGMVVDVSGSLLLSDVVCKPQVDVLASGVGTAGVAEKTASEVNTLNSWHCKR
jgi:hypothetical protein